MENLSKIRPNHANQNRVAASPDAILPADTFETRLKTGK